MNAPSTTEKPSRWAAFAKLIWWAAAILSLPLNALIVEEARKGGDANLGIFAAGLVVINGPGTIAATVAAVMIALLLKRTGSPATRYAYAAGTVLMWLLLVVGFMLPARK